MRISGCHRFSAVGVTAVLSLAAALPAQNTALPELTLEPVVTIPGEGDGYYLTAIGRAVLSPYGTLVLRDLTPEVALYEFGLDGRLVHRIGREGQGPGEYLMVQWLGLLGDTLWTVDPRLRRVTWWLDGDVLRTQSWGDSALVTMPQAFLDDGTIVTTFATGSDRFRPLIRERGGETVAELPVLRTAATVVTRDLGLPNVSSRFRDPWAAHTLRSAAPSGSGVAWVERLRPESDTASSYRVVLWRNGKVVDVRIPYEPLPLAYTEKEWWAALVDAYATQLGPRIGVSRREMTRAFEEGFPEPAFALPVHQVELDDEGHVWLAVESTPEVVTWVRLGPDLEPGARLSIPVDEKVLEIGYGKVVTVWKDEWDVPELRVHRLKGGS